MNAKDLIQKLQLQPHPEGGYYKQTYRSNEKIVTDDGRARNVSTAIYYLLEKEGQSHFHRIKSDELWFFHLGQALEIISIQNNELITILLGNDIENGEVLQAMIQANTWFAAKIKNGSGFSLVSCSVAPGFDFADFDLAIRKELVQQFPLLINVIENFTRE